MRRAKSLRIGVHHADAVVWGPVYRTHLGADDAPLNADALLREMADTSDLGKRGELFFVGQARSIHWSPYDPVAVVNADPYGLFPACLSAHSSVSIPALGAFQLHLTPFNSTPTFACMERP